MTPRAPPTKNSRFCSTEGAGPGGVAAPGSSARPGYRAGAAAAGKCPRDGLGGGGLISAEHSCWGPRETEERAVPGWSRSLGRGAVCAGPALERGALGTATLRERARPRDWAGSGTCGVRSPVRRWAGDPPQLPVTAAAQGGERSAPRAAGTEIPNSLGVSGAASFLLLLLGPRARSPPWRVSPCRFYFTASAESRPRGLKLGTSPLWAKLLQKRERPPFSLSPAAPSFASAPRSAGGGGASESGAFPREAARLSLALSVFVSPVADAAPARRLVCPAVLSGF